MNEDHAPIEELSFMRVKELVVQQDGDSYTISVDKKTFECTAVSLNIIDIIGDVYLMGMDNPEKFELYESVRRAEVVRYKDNSIVIEIFIEGF